LGGTRAKLEALGIEALGITEDSAEPVRSYYRIRPSKLRLATDPKRDVHHRYGLPMPFYAGAYTQLREATLTNPTGELPAPMPIPAGMKVLDEKDGLPTLPEAKAVMDAFAKRDYAMHVGHFLVDRSGVVRGHGSRAHRQRTSHSTVASLRMTRSWQPCVPPESDSSQLRRLIDDDG
jgi:hypothetical protein